MYILLWGSYDGVFMLTLFKLLFKEIFQIEITKLKSNKKITWEGRKSGLFSTASS